MAVIIRPYTTTDLARVYELYCRNPQQVDDPIFTPSVEQFSTDLKRGRLYQPAKIFNPNAEIALVAEKDGAIVAFGSGGQLAEGDFLVEADTAFIRLIIGDRKHKDAVRQIIRHLTQHLNALNPITLQAYNSVLTPAFFGCMSGMLPSNWNWIAQCLMDEGYKTEFTSLYMYRDFQTDPPTPLPFPDGFRCDEWKTYVMEHTVGLDPKFNIGYALHEGDEYAGWCGNFYAGTWFAEADYEYVYTNWFTIMQPFLGRGLGRMLLRHGLVKAYEQGAKGAMLMTNPDNFIAQDLYRSESYRIIDVGNSFVLRQPVASGEE